MPGHRTHERTGLFTAPVVAAGSIYYGLSVPTTGILVLGYIFSTYFLSPDLDHDVGAASYRRWGILRFIWYPYKRLVHHRSWISHSGPISATLKIVYLLVWFVPLIYVLPREYLTYNPLYAILWLSVALSDTAHCIMDLIWKDR